MKIPNSQSSMTNQIPMSKRPIFRFFNHLKISHWSLIGNCLPAGKAGKLVIGYFILFLVSCSLFFVVAVSAVEPKSESLNMLKNAGGAAGYAPATEFSMAFTVGRIINGALGLLGVLFLALTVYAGYLWLTAGGEEEQVKKAKDYLRNGLIGLVVVLASWGVARFVVQAIINSTMGE